MDMNNIKTIQLFRSANMGRFILHMKQRSEALNVNLWPSYGVMTMYNITEIFWFHKSAANCDRWPTSQVSLYIVYITLHCRA